MYSPTTGFYHHHYDEDYQAMQDDYTLYELAA